MKPEDAYRKMLTEGAYVGGEGLIDAGEPHHAAEIIHKSMKAGHAFSVTHHGSAGEKAGKLDLAHKTYIQPSTPADTKGIRAIHTAHFAPLRK